MATMVLAGVGQAVGFAIGGPIGAALGQAVGAAVGGMIDRWLFTPTQRVNQEGPRLSEQVSMTSVEGAQVMRGYGRFKTGGQVIWMTRLLEEVVKESSKQGGKGGGGVVTTTTTYNYYANFAVALSEGEILGIHRVWADGKLLDLSDITYRVYRGTEDQEPDSLIESKEGAGNAPAYRGIAYVVFESMLLTDYGNRIPQLTFEVTRPVSRVDADGVRDLITAVGILPGATEFGYDPNVVEQVTYGDDDEEDEIVERNPENNHLSDGNSDWDNALDQMAINLPNANLAVLTVTWFASDLRAASCEIKPKVENSTKVTDPISWKVDVIERATADVVSTYDGAPAFLGSPNDVSVYNAIIDLAARGFEVMIYPVIECDIESGNSLANPYSDNAATNGQAVYPHRNKITVSPAIGYTGTVDQTATAATQISAFLGTADASEFSGTAGAVAYTGTAEWSYRRFILHMAKLASQAGGVDYFVMGGQMKGLTSIRDNTDAFPFVDGLVSLAAEVATMLPSAQLSYAAAWNEYHSYQPDDGSDDVYFNMDPLWSDSNIDFVGIDAFFPLTDWRDNDEQLDLETYESIYDLTYLKAGIEGGEYFDWYYASAADRATQTRTTITDATYSKPWVFAIKDMRSWWENLHYDRPAGVEAGTETDWTAEDKPIIFTSFGCPAIDKGSNLPDTKYNPKSSAPQVPHFSTGNRDDEIQRQYIRAVIEYWVANTEAGFIDATRLAVMGYDARPWPTFPANSDTWNDQDVWQYGYWISGRIDTVYMPDLLASMAEDYGLSFSYDFSRAYGACDGFVIQNKVSLRSAIEPLASLFMFDIIESGDTLKAVSQRDTLSRATLDLDDITMAEEDSEPVMVTRMQASELPSSMEIQYIDVTKDYETASARADREVGTDQSEPSSETPVVMDLSRAQPLVDMLVYSAWARRTSAEFGTLPEFVYLEPGDVVTLSLDTYSQAMRLESVADTAGRRMQARSFDRGIFTQATGISRTVGEQPIQTRSDPIIAMMDLPMLGSEVVPYQPYVAGYMKPWPGMNLYRSVTDSNYSIDTTMVAATVIGKTTAALNSGPIGVWDNANELKVHIYDGELSSLPEINVLSGANTMAIETSTGWEIVQFVNVTVTGDGLYTLTQLLRGQLDTEDNMDATLAAGARVVLLESTVQQTSLSLGDIGKTLYYKYGPADKAIGHASYRSTTKAFTGRGLKPYSVEHVEAVDSSGDIIISWVRRTRFGGDDWQDGEGEVPLNEATEEYEIDVLDGADNVLRTLTVTDATTVTYTAAQQTADSVPDPFDVIIYQMSDTIGRGNPRRATINV